jgi:hypothetical protein
MATSNVDAAIPSAASSAPPLYHSNKESVSTLGVTDAELQDTNYPQEVRQKDAPKPRAET